MFEISLGIRFFFAVCKLYIKLGFIMSDSDDETFLQFLMNACSSPQGSSESSSSSDSFLEKEEPVVRIKHAKIINFVEDVVSQYSEEEFKSHFRMSRTTADELIGTFFCYY